MIRSRSPQTRASPGLFLLHTYRCRPGTEGASISNINQSIPIHTHDASLRSMRIWLVLFMVSIGLLTPLLRPALRSATLRTALKPLYNLGHLDLHNSRSSQVSLQSTTMSNLASAVAASAPSDTTQSEPSATIVSNTKPAEAELPKLSAADFRIYNRLAVMMDAYVGLPLQPTKSC